MSVTKTKRKENLIYDQNAPFKEVMKAVFCWDGIYKINKRSSWN